MEPSFIQDGYDTEAINAKARVNQRIKELDRNRHRYRFSTYVFFSINCEKARKCPKNKGRITGSVFDGLDKSDWERVPVTL